MSDDLAILSKKQGTYILNTNNGTYDATTFDVIKVVAATRLSFEDTSGLNELDYISSANSTIPAGTEIRPFKGGKFTTVTIATAGGAVELTI